VNHKLFAELCKFAVDIFVYVVVCNVCPSSFLLVATLVIPRICRYRALGESHTKILYNFPFKLYVYT
jgi:hypothetical protein